MRADKDDQDKKCEMVVTSLDITLRIDAKAGRSIAAASSAIRRWTIAVAPASTTGKPLMAQCMQIWIAAVDPQPSMIVMRLLSPMTAQNIVWI